jgi:hypothetical protein
MPARQVRLIEHGLADIVGHAELLFQAAYGEGCGNLAMPFRPINAAARAGFVRIIGSAIRS